MPMVHIHVVRGRPAAQRRAILDAVHAALVEAFRIPEADRHQLLHEHDPENFDSARGPEFTLVEATVFPGRSEEAKAALFEGIVRRLEAAGVPRDKVLIALHEPPLASWGIRGGQSAARAGVPFKLDV